MLKPENKFKFTTEYQWDLLRYTVQDKNGENALKKYDDDYFTLIEHQVLAHALKTFYKKNRRIPGETILRENVSSLLTSKQYINLVTKDEQTTIISLIKNLYNIPVKDGDIIYASCKEFKRYVLVRNLLTNFDLNNYQAYEQFSKQIGVALADEDQMQNYENAFLLENIKERQFRRQDRKTIYPTPFKQINQLTNAGGYESGSILVLLDKQKKGKTTMLANAARGYLRMGKKVVIVDLENGEDNIFARLEQSIMDIDKKTLLSGDKDNDIQKRFRKYKRIGGEVVVLRRPALITDCNDIQNDLDILYRDFGFRADVLIVDYAAKMKSSTYGGDEDRTRISNVYLELGNLALKNDILHIWTANHVTREAAKVRQKTKYVGEDIANCVDIVRHAQAIFGLNRSEPEEEAGFFRMEIVEQRDGQPDGRAVFKANLKTQRVNELTSNERQIYDTEFYKPFVEQQSESNNVVSKRERKDRKDDFRDAS